MQYNITKYDDNQQFYLYISKNDMNHDVASLYTCETGNPWQRILIKDCW